MRISERESVCVCCVPRVLWYELVENGEVQILTAGDKKRRGCLEPAAGFLHSATIVLSVLDVVLDGHHHISQA